MQLTSETFNVIVQSLKSDKGDQSKEQRKAPRVGIRGKATIYVLSPSGNRTMAVTIRDLSTSGIGILVAEEVLKKESQFLLILPNAQGRDQRAIACRVKRLSMLGRNQFAVGASYERQLSNEDLVRELRLASPKSAAVKAPPPASGRQVAVKPSDELLGEADAAVVSDLETRLRAVS